MTRSNAVARAVPHNAGMESVAARPRVVVLGGGFGGLWAARGLALAPVDVTLIDRTNHHLFQPLLYQVAAASLSGTDIAAPLRHIVRRQSNLVVWMDEVNGIDLAARCVHLHTRDVHYDYLVVATGSTHAYFGHDDWACHAPGLKTMGDALAIRQRVLAAFEAAEREADPRLQTDWLNFVIVGGGPTGVELAGTLAEMAHHTLPREFRQAETHRARIHLIEAGPRVLAALPPDLSAVAASELVRMGVEVHVDAAVTGIDALGVDVGDARIPARTTIWAAGVAASALGAQLDTKLDRAGRVQVAPDLSLPRHPEVFVVGDLAWVECAGRRVPGVAPAAKQMGAYAARAIGARVAGRALAPFRYRDQGTLASIGRASAVVAVRRWHLHGRTGHWFWLFAHVFFLIGFRSRLAVMWNWAWSYWSWQRVARLIVGAGRVHSG